MLSAYSTRLGIKNIPKILLPLTKIFIFTAKLDTVSFFNIGSSSVTAASFSTFIKGEFHLGAGRFREERGSQWQ